jgi:hypothetical protein
MRGSSRPLFGGVGAGERARERKSTSIVHRRRRAGEVSTARTAIRNHCIECMGYQARDVATCSAPECHLWPYRMGPRVRPDGGVAPDASGG